ncbi:MAG: response regulator transcription factor [Reichenbachiella sp.]
MITVLLADDHGIVRKGIKLLLESSPDLEIIGEANDGEEALKLIEELKPNVLVTDISMPEMSGVELTQKVKENYNDTKVLVLSTHFDEEYILDSFEAGALGYLPKNANEDQIVSAIKVVAKGELFYTPSVVDILGSALISKRSPGKSSKALLTSREKEILKELVDGSTNKEIANKLFISVRTVDAHRRNIMKKLNVNNSAQLVKAAFEKRLV